jgi:hypothetical protein
MVLLNKTALSSSIWAVVICFLCESALAACNANINGRPMSQQECAQVMQVYGQVIPGNYLVDANGNWVNANNPAHRGNLYQDAQATYRSQSQGGSWSSKSYVGYSGVYDPSGGCEGGSCVNIID